MKRTLALVLVLITLIALVACKSSGKQNQESITSKITTTTTTFPSTSASSSKDEKEENDKAPSVDYTENFEVKDNETVYVTAYYLNIRTSPEVEDNSNIFASYKRGHALVCIGYNEVWSKLLINGKEYFAKSEFLTTKKPLVFKDTNDSLKVIVASSSANGTEELGKLNLRTDPFYDTENKNVGAYATTGTILKRVAVATEADQDGIIWSKVEFKGKLYYVSTGAKYVEIIPQTTPTPQPSTPSEPSAPSEPSTPSTPSEPFAPPVNPSPDPQAKLFISDNYSIMLTDEFEEIENHGIVGVSAVYDSNLCGITVSKNPLDSILFDDFVSAMAATLAQFYSLDTVPTIVNSEGIVYIELEVNIPSSPSLYSLISFNQGADGNVYTTTFECFAENKTALFPEFVKYAKTVVIATTSEP